MKDHSQELREIIGSEPEERVLGEEDPAGAPGIEQKIDRLPEAINELAMELTATAGSRGDVPRLLCDRLLEITGARTATLNLYDPENRCLRLIRFSSRGRLLPKLNRILGVTLLRVPFPVNEATHKKMLSLRAEALEGLGGLVMGTVPAPICRVADRALDIGRTYAMAYQYNGELMGTSSLAMPREAPPLPLASLETFANFGAAALHSLQTQTALAVYSQKLRKMAMDLSLAEERERSKLAEAIHDEIGQLLALSRMKLEDLNKRFTNREEKQHLEDLRGLLRQALREARALTFRLSTPLLTELGLAPALRNLGETFTMKHGIQVHVEDDGSEKPLDQALETILFRNVRELLFNVVRHARATNVWVRLRGEGGWLKIFVEDDGVGANIPDVASASRSDAFGLFSVRERMAQLGGRFTIESHPGQGFRAILSIPLGDRAE